MANVKFSQSGAKTAVGFLTTDTNPPRYVFPRRNLPTSEDLDPGDYVFTCEATDVVGTVVTVTVSGGASASTKGTITGDPGTEQTEPIDLSFSVAAGLRAKQFLSAKVSSANTNAASKKKTPRPKAKTARKTKAVRAGKAKAKLTRRSAKKRKRR
jgi:hypothetical protein